MGIIGIFLIMGNITLRTLNYGNYGYIPYYGQCRILIINRMGGPPKEGVPSLGVLIVRVLLFRVLHLGSPIYILKPNKIGKYINTYTYTNGKHSIESRKALVERLTPDKAFGDYPRMGGCPKP